MHHDSLLVSYEFIHSFSLGIVFHYVVPCILLKVFLVDSKGLTCSLTGGHLYSRFIFIIHEGSGHKAL